MKAMGIIFANDGTIGALTEKRTMASLPFGGRYRQVDFALSNLCAAGVHHVGIITRHSYQSLMNHIGSGEEWGMELEEGGLEFLTPYAMSRTDNYRGKLESLHSAMAFLEYGTEDEYVFTLMEKADAILEKLQAINVRNVLTINRLIEVALGLSNEVGASQRRQYDPLKYTRKVLNLLYKSNKHRFLDNFIVKNAQILHD